MKKLMLICAPVSSRSGYGDHSRDLVEAFITTEKYDIKIIDVNWGNTPRNALTNSDIHQKIKSKILSEPKMDRQPDVYVDIRIPNEFQTYGKFNIGITAGIETNVVSGNWLESCNKMDLIIVPSTHSREGFVQSVFDKLQQMPDGSQQKIGDLKMEKPVEVLFEGADEDVYKPLSYDEIDSNFLTFMNEKVKENFVFLSVGLWGKGGYGEDRKDLAKTIKVFYETFSNKKKQPALVLKTNGATFSIMDKEDCLRKIKEIKSHFPSDWKLPNVYLLHGNLTADEMNSLYNHPKVKALISFTHGEGFGRPLLEATMTGLPVLATNWSGQIDFLSSELSILVGGDLVDVPKSQHWNNIIIPESKWININENEASKYLSYMFENYNVCKEKANELMKINRNKFTLKLMIDKLDEIMEKHLKGVPQQVGLQLPKLKKVDKSKPTSIKLPKLKKLTETV